MIVGCWLWMKQNHSTLNHHWNSDETQSVSSKSRLLSLTFPLYILRQSVMLWLYMHNTPGGVPLIRNVWFCVKTNEWTCAVTNCIRMSWGKANCILFRPTTHTAFVHCHRAYNKTQFLLDLMNHWFTIKYHKTTSHCLFTLPASWARPSSM